MLFPKGTSACSFTVPWTALTGCLFFKVVDDSSTSFSVYLIYFTLLSSFLFVPFLKVSTFWIKHLWCLTSISAILLRWSQGHHMIPNNDLFPNSFTFLFYLGSGMSFCIVMYWFFTLNTCIENFSNPSTIINESVLCNNFFPSQVFSIKHLFFRFYTSHHCLHILVIAFPLIHLGFWLYVHRKVRHGEKLVSGMYVVVFTYLRNSLKVWLSDFQGKTFDKDYVDSHLVCAFVLVSCWSLYVTFTRQYCIIVFPLKNHFHLLAKLFFSVLTLGRCHFESMFLDRLTSLDFFLIQRYFFRICD